MNTLLLLALLSADVPDYAAVHGVLQAHCAGCHNADDPQGDFNVDSFETLSKPLSYLGEGPSLTPGQAETSQFYRYMAGLDEPRMPPEGDGDPVPEDDLKIVRAWLDGGAAGPDGAMPDRMQLLVPDIATTVAESELGYTATAIHDHIFAFAKGATVRITPRSRESKFLNDFPGRVNDLQFVGHRLAIGSGVEGLYGVAVVVDARSGEEIARVQGHRDTLYAVALSPDGTTLATAGYDRDIILWDVATGQRLRTLTGHNGAVFDLAFERSGEMLASASADETVKLWRVSDGKRLSTLPQPEGEQTAVFFSGSQTVNGKTISRHVFAAGADNRIRRWKLLNNDKPTVHPLQIARFAHEDAITHLLPFGQLVLSASSDRTVKIWRASDLTMLKATDPLPDVPSSLAVDPDNRIAVIGLMNGTRRVTPIPRRTEPKRQQVAVIDPILPEVNRETVVLAEAEAAAMPTLPLPVRIEGQIVQPGAVDVFRFDAKAGEQWVIEAKGRPRTATTMKDGKDASNEIPPKIDTVVEVRTADGEPIERVVLEAIRDSYFTFRGKTSIQSNDFRVHNWQEMELDELFYSGGEVTKLWMYPTGPDSGFVVYPGFGNRRTLFDSTPVTHALGEPAYIVRAHPPGTQLPATGLPIIRLNYRNDDAATNDRGRDSVLTFTAPADGSYQVRVSDARGFAGDDYRYALTVRPRRPDFTPSLGLQNWNDAKNKLRRGAGREVELRIKRLDDFAGPVTFHVTGLPEGLSAPDRVVVEEGQNKAILNLFASETAEQPTDEQLANIKVFATTTVAGEEVRKPIKNGLGKILVDTETKPNVTVAIDLPIEDDIPTLRIKPGETKSMRLVIERHSAKNVLGFGKEDSGRNLPHGLFVDNIGLNGLLLLADQNEREFFVTAAPKAEPQTRMWHLRAMVGGNLTSPSVRVIVEPSETGEKVASR